MKLLIIRPEPGASASAARATAAGFEPLLLPFFEVRARQSSLPDASGYDALLLTSANAVRHAGAGLAELRRLPVHTVGERTASAACGAGLEVASTGTDGVSEALKAALAAGHRRLLWLAGEDQRAMAVPSDITLDRMICYGSATLALSGDADGIIASADAVALHSPRAASVFAETVDSLGLLRASFIIAAFSPAIAKAAGGGWRAVAIAEAPSDSALLSALSNLGRQSVEVSMRKENR